MNDSTSTCSQNMLRTSVLTADFLQQLYTDCKNATTKEAGQEITLFNSAGEKFAVIKIAARLIEDIQ